MKIKLNIRAASTSWITEYDTDHSNVNYRLIKHKWYNGLLTLSMDDGSVIVYPHYSIISAVIS